MNPKRIPHSLTRCTVGAALVGTLSATVLAKPADNPFTLTPLQDGYLQVAVTAVQSGELADKTQEGSCGANMGKGQEGSCGANMDKASPGGNRKQP